MKHLKLSIIGCLFISITLYSCQNNNTIECQQGINLLPMYGRVEKCKGQLEADENFFKQSDKEEPNRTTASMQMLENGWYYLHQKDYETAIKRINQAWLLDSTNIVVYASFVVILDLTDKADNATKMIDLTFDKMNITEKDSITPINESFIEFMVNNVPFTYDKTKNPSVGQYLYKKIDNLSLRESMKESLKNKIDESINPI